MIHAAQVSMIISLCPGAHYLCSELGAKSMCSDKLLLLLFFLELFFSKPTVLQKYQQVPATSGKTNINYNKSTHTTKDLQTREALTGKQQQQQQQNKNRNPLS